MRCVLSLSFTSVLDTLFILVMLVISGSPDSLSAAEEEVVEKQSAQVSSSDNSKKDETKTKSESAKKSQQLPPARESYRGRRIAFTMSYHGADWLTRSERQQEEDGAQMLAQLRIKPGMTVCDMGCGNGYYTLKMAKLVGQQGRVLAVDIQPQMLRKMEARAAEQDLKNIDSILGDPWNPKLPAGKVDLILCVDVYHEFSHPELMLRAMRKSLKPKGVIALLEYRSEDPKVPIKRLHKMSKKQIMKEYLPNGFKLAREYDKLPWQHMMFFARDEDWKEK